MILKILLVCATTLINLQANSQCRQDSVIASGLLDQADAHFAESSYDSAYSAIMRAMEIAERCGYHKSGLYASAISNLGVYWIYKHGNLDSGFFYMKKSYSIAKAIYKDDDPELAIQCTNLGFLFLQIDGLDSASYYFQNAFEIFMRDSVKNAESIAYLYTNLGMINMLQGNYEEALKYNFDCLRIRERALGVNHPGVCQCLINLSENYINLESFRDALKYLYRAEKILSAHEGYEREKSVMWNNLAFCHDELGDSHKALDGYLKSLDFQTKIYEPEHPELASTFANIGAVYLKMKDEQKAEEYIRKSLAINLASFGEEHSETGLDFTQLGNVRLAQNQMNEAIYYYKKALMAFKTTFGQYHGEVAGTYLNLSKAYGRLNDFKNAFAYLDSFVQVNDSVWRIERVKNIDRLKEQYESAAKENRIELLNAEREIDRLELERQQLKIEKSRQNMGLLGIGFMILAALGTGIYMFRSRKLKARFARQAGETQLQLLKSLMDKHFIFSSLSSVDLFLKENEPEAASNYLLQFSKLVRSVLEKSGVPEISLQEELEICATYLALEKIRMDNQFEYEIMIDDNLKTGEIAFPALMLQPVVENAVRHGMASLIAQGVAGGRISLEATRHNNLLKCVVRDNGNGFSEKREAPGDKTSYSTKGIAERISVYNRLHGNKASFKFENTPDGAMATLTIPLMKLNLRNILS